MEIEHYCIECHRRHTTELEPTRYDNTWEGVCPNTQNIVQLRLPDYAVAILVETTTGYELVFDDSVGMEGFLKAGEIRVDGTAWGLE